MTDGLTYFVNITTLAAGRRRYRQLAKKLHPDNVKTGDGAAFLAMAQEWEMLQQIIAREKEPPAAPRRRRANQQRSEQHAAPSKPAQHDIAPSSEQRSPAERRLRRALYDLGIAGAEMILQSLIEPDNPE